MAELAHFTHQVEESIDAARRASEHALLTPRNLAVQAALDAGGFCDAALFTTAFYGGLGQAANEANDAAQDRGRADIPETVEQALAVGRQVGFAAHEPFLGAYRPGANIVDWVGLVLPGTPGHMPDGVYYKIETPSDDQQIAGRLLGSVVGTVVGTVGFNGLRSVSGGSRAVVRDYVLLRVAREATSIQTEVRRSVQDTLRIGMPAVREAMQIGYPYNAALEQRVHLLRKEARDAIAELYRRQ